MKAAVVGSGMAAAAVVSALRDHAPEAEVTVIERGEAVHGPAGAEPPQPWSRQRIAALYRHLHRTVGYSFPPPKSHFGAVPDRAPVAGWGRVWSGHGFGGLSTYWGGSATVFSKADIAAWGIDPGDFAPHYQRIADLVGIAGRHDALAEVMGWDFVTRPPIRPVPLAERLAEAVAAAPADTAYRLVAGSSRMAVSAADCTYCGECMLGCPTDAVYAAAPHLARLIAAASPQRLRLITGCSVRSFDPASRRLTLRRGGVDEVTPPFDRIYLCGGCLDTSVLAMRSLGISEIGGIVDNAVSTFPILRPAGIPGGDAGYFSLTNLLLAAVPRGGAGRLAMLQVYPSFDHLWRYFLPSPAWPLAAGVAQAVRRRVLWGRIYCDSSLSQRYRLRLVDDQPRLELERPPVPLRDIPGLWDSVRRGLGRDGFWVPDLFAAHKTSSHLAAGLPMGGGLADLAGRLAPGVHACDASLFPASPAASPSLTIMANAHRVACLSLEGCDG